MTKRRWAILACGLAVLAGAGMLSRDRPRTPVVAARAVETPPVDPLAFEPVQAPAARPQAAAPSPGKAKEPLFTAAPLVVPSVSLDRLAQPDPVLRRRAEIRAVRAVTLDRRLEARIADVRERLGRATGAERDALAADLAVLEKNLAFRRRLENGAHGQGARPTSS